VPTYSYACTECDNRFDAVQAFTDDALQECPKCGGRLRKLFGSVGVVFKGSGFYRTDSRAGSGSDSSDGEKKKSSTSADSSSSDTKSSSESSSESSSKSSSKSSSESNGDSTSASAAAAAAAS
jgi:putative FmdB family regulatory protein